MHGVQHFRSTALRTVHSFRRNQRGTVLIMTALFVPLLLVAMLGGTTVMMALSKRQQLQAIAQAACNRAVKPLRSVIADDAARQLKAQTLFDDMAGERKLAITSRTVTVGWLTASVTANAKVPVMPGWGPQVAVPISASETCAGIPPYPALQDVVLSSNFKTPSGTSLELKDRWGLFTPQQVGWDGGAGPAIELQDWTNGFQVETGRIAYLPPGVTNPFVVELDSDLPPGAAKPPAATCGPYPGKGNYNSSMYKDIELHPGTYRFSLWFRGRIAANKDKTNAVSVYLEGINQTPKPKREVIAFGGDSTTWTQQQCDIDIDSYGLYRVTLAPPPDSCGDSYGGLFNDLKLSYVRRPYPEYNDTLTSPPAKCK